MKNLLFSIVVLVCMSYYSFSQSASFNYQAVVRDALGVVMENQNVSIKIDILKSTSSGISVYSEEHSVTTNQFGLVNLEIGSGTILSGNFSTITWGTDIYFLQTEIDVTGGTNYQLMGVSQLLSVPYALFSQSSADSSLWEKNVNDIYYDIGNVGVGTITPNGRLQVNSDTAAGINDVIFSVLNANGDTVFAVYQEGVRIWVDDNGGTKANGSRGGFAVGGFSPTKAGFTNEYLRVTPDSVRIYIDDSYIPAKANGSRGGFAVGGFNPAKGTISNNYLFVQDDSTRIYTGDTISGFSIGDISGGTSVNYMHLTPLNYFIGHQSGINTYTDILNPETGKYNTFIGYQTGQFNTTGYQNTFIGYQAGQYHINGAWNLFLGQHSGYNNIDGLSNIFIGKNAGYNVPSGTNNMLIGNDAGYSVNTTSFWNNIFIGNNSGRSITSGYNNTFVGIGSGADATFGEGNTYVGSGSGGFNPESFNTYIGSDCGIYASLGERNVFMGFQAGTRSYGNRNVFIGHRADYNSMTSYNNSVAIGDSVMCTASNQVRLGNANTQTFYCQGAYASTTSFAANLYVSTTGQIRRSTSSKRYKKNITKIEINTSDIYKLEPVSYTSKIDNKRHFGLIAEDVAKFIPELAEFAVEKDVVPGSKSNKLIPDAVQYPLLSVLLLKEVQIHENTIKNLESKIAHIESVNKKKEEDIKKLEKRLKILEEILNSSASKK